MLAPSKKHGGGGAAALWEAAVPETGEKVHEQTNQAMIQAGRQLQCGVDVSTDQR